MFAISWLEILHHGGPLTPDTLWSAWNGEPALLVPLGIAVFGYTWGVSRAWRRAGAGRGISLRRCVYFLGAVLALAVALISPLDAVSGALFSAHMIQHLILIFAAAPLLVLADLPLALVWALPRQPARALGRLLSGSRAVVRVERVLDSPITAWLAFTLLIWLWHTPVLYESALRSETLHAAEHLTFLLAGMLFWQVLFKNTRPETIRRGVAIPYLFTTVLQSGIFGALLTFSSRPWYAYYAARVGAWGLTPLEDQQLAGLFMWLPGGVVFTLLTIRVFAAWLRALSDMETMKHTKE